MRGGGFDVAPKASLDDGLLDVAMISHDADFNLSIARQELQNPFDESNRYIHYRQVTEFALTSDDRLHCNLDGEPVHKRKFKFSVLPKHLRLAISPTSLPKNTAT